MWKWCSSSRGRLASGCSRRSSARSCLSKCWCSWLSSSIGVAVRLAQRLAGVELEMTQETLGANADTSFSPAIPLHQSTWELDVEEGEHVNHMKATRLEALAEPLIEVPEEFDRNIAVTSVDAPNQLGAQIRRLASVVRACVLRVRDDGERHVSLRHIALRHGGV